MRHLLQTDDSGKNRVAWLRPVGFAAIYSVVLLTVGWTIDQLRGAPFRVDQYAIFLLSVVLSTSIGIHLTILRARGRSSRQFSLMTLFIAITGASVLFGAMSWFRQRDLELFATRRRLEATLSSIIGQGRASVGSSTLIIVKRATFNDSDFAKVADLQPQLLKAGSPIYFLALEGTKVSDAGISRLAQIDSLEYCFLGQTSLSDVSIKTLVQLPRLKRLDLHSTRVTNDALLRLSKARPDISIMPMPNARPKQSPSSHPLTYGNSSN